MAGKRKRLLRWIIPLVLIAAVAAVLLLRPQNAVSYAHTEAYTGDISTSYSFTGTINAPRSQRLLAPEGATVKEVYVSANARVRSGDRVLRLSTGEVVKSDIAGEVVALNVRKDDAVAAGAELAMIIDMELLEARIAVDEYDAPAVRLGNAVEITVNATGQSSVGTVTAIDKNASVSGEMSTYYATVSLQAPEGALPGMQVEGVMLNERAEGVTLLPAEALSFDASGRAYALTADAEGKHIETYVETGINDGVVVQITSGLSAGQTVYFVPKGGNDMMLLFMSRGGGAAR